MSMLFDHRKRNLRPYSTSAAEALSADIVERGTVEHVVTVEALFGYC